MTVDELTDILCHIDGKLEVRCMVYDPEEKKEVPKLIDSASDIRTFKIVQHFGPETPHPDREIDNSHYCVLKIFKP